MLEFMDCEQDDALAWRISGKVTDDDMKRVLDSLRSKLEDHGKVSVLQEIGDLDGVELDALAGKLSFFREFGSNCFQRIAVVSDRKWIRTVVGWEDRLFRGFRMRAFSSEERDRAFNFLAYGDSA